MAGTVHVLGALDALVQQGWLERAMADALAPLNHYRNLAEPLKFEGSIGDTKTRTRRGLMLPSPRPIARPAP